MPIGKNSIKRAAKAVETAAPKEKSGKGKTVVATSVIGAISPEVVEKVIKHKTPAKKSPAKSAKKSSAPKKTVKIKEETSLKTPMVAIGEDLPVYLL